MQRRFNGVRQLTRCGGAVVMLVAALLSGSEGSAVGNAPFVVKDINPAGSSDPAGFFTVGRFTYFRAADDMHGSELWRTDGRERGTSMVADINPGSPWSFPSDLTVFNGRLFLAATTNETGREVWFSDGTAAGTMLLRDINPGPADAFAGFGGRFVEFRRELYFPGWDAFGIELWKTDGTGRGTTLVKDIHTGHAWSIPVYLNELRGDILFAADDLYTPSLNCFNRELWRSDGTEEGTTRIKDINPGPCGSIPGELTRFGGTILFAAGDGMLGAELWKTDGTEEGTVMVKDINVGPGSAFPMMFRRAGSHVFFAADDGSSGAELWRTDGTSSGTARVKDVNPGPRPSHPLAFTPLRHGLLFAADDGAHGHELWFTDGTELGTRLVADLVPGGVGSSPTDLTTVGDDAYFTIRVDLDASGTASTELWRTDGTPQGTRRLWRAPGRFPGPSIREPAVGRHHLFFAAPTTADADGRSADFELHALAIGDRSR